MGILSCLKATFGHCYDRYHRTSYPIIRHPSRHRILAPERNKARELLAQELLKAKQAAKEVEQIPLAQLNPHVVPSVSAELICEEQPVPTPEPEITRKQSSPLPEETPSPKKEKLTPSILERRSVAHFAKNLPMPSVLATVRAKSPDSVASHKPIVVEQRLDLLSTSAFVLKYAGTQCFHNDKTPLPKMAEYMRLLNDSISFNSAFLTDEPAWQALPEEAISHAKIHLKERKYKFMTEIEKELSLSPRPYQVVLIANGYNPMAVALAEKYPQVVFFVTDKSKAACDWNKEAYAKLGLKNIVVVHSDCAKDNLIYQLEKTSFDIFTRTQCEEILFNRTSNTVFALEGISYYLTSEQENTLLEFCLNLPADRSVVLMDYKDECALNAADEIKNEQGNPEPYYHNLITYTIEELTACDPLRLTSYRKLDKRLFDYYRTQSMKNYDLSYCDMDETDRANLHRIDHDYDDLRFCSNVVGAEMVKITTKPKNWDNYRDEYAKLQAAPLAEETKLNPPSVPNAKIFVLPS